MGRAVEAVDSRVAVSQGTNLEEALRKGGITGDPVEEGCACKVTAHGKVGHVLTIAIRVGNGSLGGIQLGIGSCFRRWEETCHTGKHGVNLGHRKSL
jgi:hypothetical protein